MLDAGQKWSGPNFLSLRWSVRHEQTTLSFITLTSCILKTIIGINYKSAIPLMIIILLYTVFFMVKRAIEKYQSKEITLREDIYFIWHRISFFYRNRFVLLPTVTISHNNSRLGMLRFFWKEGTWLSQHSRSLSLHDSTTVTNDYTHWSLIAKNIFIRTSLVKKLSKAQRLHTMILVCCQNGLAPPSWFNGNSC